MNVNGLVELNAPQNAAMEICEGEHVQIVEQRNPNKRISQTKLT
jgi:hypothetical protein